MKIDILSLFLYEGGGRQQFYKFTYSHTHTYTCTTYYIQFVNRVTDKPFVRSLLSLIILIKQKLLDPKVLCV